VISDDAVTDAHLREILASAEFQPPPSDRVWQGIVDFLKSRLCFLNALGTWTRLSLALVAIALLLVLAVLAWRSLGSTVAPSSPPGVRPKPTGSAGLPRASSLADEARRHAAAGHWRAAARALHQATLLHCCERSGTAWREAVSNWEWVARFPSWPRLEAFTREAERLAFGQSPDALQFASCLRFYDEITGQPP
jgi:hypothetical protein